MKRLTIVIALAASTLTLTALGRAQQPDARAQRTWKAKCASCHGEDGKGQTAQARQKFGGGLRDLSSPEVQKGFDDAKLKEVIQKGLVEKKDGKELNMPANPSLAGEQLDGLVRAVRSLASGK